MMISRTRYLAHLGRIAGHHMPEDGVDVSRFTEEGLHYLNLEGSVSERQIAFLAALASADRPRQICQTGFNYGLSAFALLCGTVRLVNTTVLSWDLGQHVTDDGLRGAHVM